MKLYFGGCSGVAGQDLANPNRDAFPALVARDLGADFVNDARAGSGNLRILNRAVANLGDYDHYVISWTSTDRQTLISNKLLSEAHLTLSFKDHALLKKYAPFQDYAELYYGFWYSPLREFQQLLTYIIVLERTFKQLGLGYTMAMTSKNAWPAWTGDYATFCAHAQYTGVKVSDDQLQEEYRQTQRLKDSIDWDNFVHGGSFFLTELSTHYPVGPTRHPLEECHRMYAREFLTHIKEKL